MTQPAAHNSPANDTGASAPPMPYAALVRLAAQADSRFSYFAQAMRLIAQTCASPYAAIYVRLPSEVIQDDCHFGSTNPAFWKKPVQQILLDALSAGRTQARLYTAANGNARVGLIAVPLFSPTGAAIGTLALVTPITEVNARRRVALIESLAALASYLAADVGVETVARASSTPAGETSAAAAAALARAATMESVEELAFALTNNLRNKLGCRQVALGIVQGRRVRVVSVSGLDEAPPASPGIARIRDAMEECLDFDAPITCFDGQTESVHAPAGSHRLHVQWVESARGGAAATIPLKRGRRTVAIVALQAEQAESLSLEKLEQIRARIEPYAPALTLLHEARRGLLRHATDAVRGNWRRLREPGKPGRKLSLAMTLFAATWFFFGTMPYTVSVPCVVVPLSARQVSAPCDAPLSAVHVVSGDTVRRGQLLCELDRGELELQRRETAAQLEIAEQEHQRAMAAAAPVDAQLAQAHERLLAARLALIDRRIEATRIRSPIDGLVVSGNLRTRVGAVMPLGETLFLIAPAGSWQLELLAPESIADDLMTACAGRFVGRARPEEPHDFYVTHVRAAPEVREGRNALIAEARIADAPDWLRPGMEGAARLDLGPRRVCWIALHKVMDFMRLNFWL
ncbi:MAG: biotin/lipoyl-binding protein [Phycisphaerae bacterium]|nr:biotin/lipoyl-binding protein [Phycisphaerae bacterium]NUQ47632.1 biotin/lipoyl-binding protein [Phycisphaerae bacterium]